jgi:hypothetical protein
MAKRRRILEKLVINEISGVDFPCQEGAGVAIMKRKATNMNEEVEGQMIDLEARIEHLTKTLATVTDKAEAKKDFDPFKRVRVTDFEQTVAEIQKRDACTATEAMAKARKENAAGFANYQANETNADFDSLVAAEIAKGCAPSVAAQRVGLKYPNAAAAMIAKKDKHPFEKLVDAIMEQDGVTRSVAMSRARKQEPVKFAHYQGL